MADYVKTREVAVTLDDADMRGVTLTVRGGPKVGAGVGGGLPAGWEWMAIVTVDVAGGQETGAAFVTDILTPEEMSVGLPIIAKLMGAGIQLAGFAPRP